MQIYLMPLFYEIIRSKIKPHQGFAQTTLSLGVRRRDSFEGLRRAKQENSSTDDLNDDGTPSTLDYTEDVVKFMELCIHLTQEGYQFALRIKLHLDAKAKQASLSALSPLENLKKEIRDFDLTTNPYLSDILSSQDFQINKLFSLWVHVRLSLRPPVVAKLFSMRNFYGPIMLTYI